jgi:hypothetical protein
VLESRRRRNGWGRRRERFAAIHPAARGWQDETATLLSTPGAKRDKLSNRPSRKTLGKTMAEPEGRPVLLRHDRLSPEPCQSVMPGDQLRSFLARNIPCPPSRSTDTDQPR